ncbi:MAG: hypothetical protein V7675_11740 [Hyphomonas sp.]|uniref:GumC family protein n=1 Tax=Hyphomonas sp. TaxID=87 RepID=UPI0030013D5B
MPVTEAPSRDPEGNGLVRTSAPRLRLGTADVLVQFWRAKWLMLLVFVPVFALGLAAALSRPDQFEAKTRLMVTGASALGPKALVGPELEFLRSPVVASRALNLFPMSRIYPQINAACEARSRALRGDAEALAGLAAECRQMCVAALQGDFHVRSASNAPVMTVSYRNSDPEAAAEVLNAVIGVYIKYRSDVLSRPEPEAAPEVERSTLERRLMDSETAISVFLNEEGISSFEAERETVQALYQTASADLLATDSRLRQVESQLTAYRSQIRGIRPRQELFVEDTTGQTLLDMKLEREALLVTNLPGSDAVQEMNRRIDRAEAFIATLDQPVGTVRTGPNPRYEQMLGRIDDLKAEAAALTDQQAALSRQIAAFKERQAKLAALAPRYNELMRKRDVLEQDMMSTPGSGAGTDAWQGEEVRVLEPASVPTEPAATRAMLAALAFAVALGAALCAGILKALTRTGFATRRSVERTLDLPVLATAREA